MRTFRVPEQHAVLYDASGCGKKLSARVAAPLSEFECVEFAKSFVDGDGDGGSGGQPPFSATQRWKEELTLLLRDVIVDERRVCLIVEDSVLRLGPIMDVVQHCVSPWQCLELFTKEERDAMLFDVQRQVDSSMPSWCNESNGTFALCYAWPPFRVRT